MYDWASITFRNLPIQAKTYPHTQPAHEISIQAINIYIYQDSDE